MENQATLSPGIPESSHLPAEYPQVLGNGPHRKQTFHSNIPCVKTSWIIIEHWISNAILGELRRWVLLVRLFQVVSRPVIFTCHQLKWSHPVTCASKLALMRLLSSLQYKGRRQ